MIVDKKLFDSLMEAGSSNSQSDDLTKPLRIYRTNVDISGVPRNFHSLVGGGGYYEFPDNDIQVLDWSPKPSQPGRFGTFNKSDLYEIYIVQVEAERCTMKECLELLKGIGSFIACSVEWANAFYASLNKDGAVRLKGLNGVCAVYRNAEILVQN